MKPKHNTIRRKSFVILALVAVLFVLHALVSSNPAMAERVFTDNVMTQETAAVETSLNGVSDTPSVGQDEAKIKSIFLIAYPRYSYNKHYI